MWYVTQVAACLLVAAVNSMFRQWGLSVYTYCVAIMCSTLFVPLFALSYEKAPTFFQAWFLGNTALVLFGLGASVLFFDGVLCLRYYVGMGLALTAGYLLVT